MTVIRPVARVWALVASGAIVVLACASPAATPTRPAQAATSTCLRPRPQQGSRIGGHIPGGESRASQAASRSRASLRGPRRPVTGSLDVLEWDGYQKPIYWADFAAKYPDVAVNFTFGISDADIHSKMLLGDPSDIFHAYTGWLHFYVDEGLVAEIDTSKLANWDKVPEAYKTTGTSTASNISCRGTGASHRSCTEPTRWRRSTAGASFLTRPTTTGSRCGTTAQAP